MSKINLEVFYLFEFVMIFLTGFFCYPLLEILWRGFSHPAMALAGGICFLVIYLINIYLPNKNILLKSLYSAVAITGIEFIFGYFCNLKWNMNIWDYSSIPFNFMGQICMPYFVLWFFLCIILSPFCSFLRSFVFA